MESRAEGEEILGHGPVLDAGRSKAEAGNDPLGVERKQQVEAFIPAQAVAPANVCLGGRPARAPRRLADLVGTPELSRAS